MRALMVSIDTGRPSLTTAGSTGLSRASSSSADDRLGAAIGPRRFRADVEDVGALVGHLAAWAMAMVGSTKWPPSEKESGVTLRMPMTSGRPRASSAARLPPAGFGTAPGLSMMVAASGMPVALRGRRGAVKAAPSPRGARARRGPRRMTGQERQYEIFSGSFLALSIQRATTASDGSRRTHLRCRLASAMALASLAGVAALELAHGIDAGRLQQLAIFLADALDAHAVGTIGPAEQLFDVEAGLCRELLAALHGAGDLEQLAGRPNARLLEASRQSRGRFPQYR